MILLSVCFSISSTRKKTLGAGWLGFKISVGLSVLSSRCSISLAFAVLTVGDIRMPALSELAKMGISSRKVKKKIC